MSTIDTTARSAMKLALEALETCEWVDDGGDGHAQYDPGKVIGAINTIREALADHIPDATKMMEPAQQQEPLFWYDEEEGWLHDNYDDAPSGCIPLYTFPPASKPWVRLTDEEKAEIKKQANYNWETTAGEYASKVQALTEAKLREKNNG